jgi:hypothetical protein
LSRCRRGLRRAQCTSAKQRGLQGGERSSGSALRSAPGRSKPGATTEPADSANPSPSYHPCGLKRADEDRARSWQAEIAHRSPLTSPAGGPAGIRLRALLSSSPERCWGFAGEGCEGGVQSGGGWRAGARRISGGNSQKCRGCLSRRADPAGCGCSDARGRRVKGLSKRSGFVGRAGHRPLD